MESDLDRTLSYSRQFCRVAYEVITHQGTINIVSALSRNTSFLKINIDLGADLPNLKTLRDTEWNNLRRSALKRFVENQKTGAKYWSHVL